MKFFVILRLRARISRFLASRFINLPNITPESIVVTNNSSNNGYTRTNTFNEKNYLNVRLDEKSGETQKTLTIRLLPMDLETGNPFVKVHMHNVHVPKEVSKSGYKSYICLSKNKDIDHETYGNKCPFCELNLQDGLNAIGCEDIKSMHILELLNKAYE